MVTVSIASFAGCSLAELVSAVFANHLAINDPVIILDGNLIFDALEDDEEALKQYSESLEYWGFSANGQMLQVEDSVTNETFHVSVKQDSHAEMFTVNGEPIAHH